jgi:hypothetical protein
MAADFLIKINSKSINFILIILVIFYLSEPANTILRYKPYNFIFGRQNRDEFLEERIYIYPLVQKINRLPSNSKVWLINVDPVSYYIEKDTYQESIFEDYKFRKKLKYGIDSLIEFLKQNSITHILMNEFRTKEHLSSYKDRNILRYFYYFRDNYLKIEEKRGDFILYRLKNLNERKDTHPIIPYF